MSRPWSWFCKHCLEDHITKVCPINSEFKSPFRDEPGAPMNHTTDTRDPAELLTELIARLIESTNASIEQTKTINALVEQNQLLIQAMAGEEGVEEADRYQTL